MNSSENNKPHNSQGDKYTATPSVDAPDSYGPIDAEVMTVRESIGIVDLSGRGKLRISGKEHEKLLQGMVSNDVIKIENLKGAYATSLTVKGKMVTDMRAYKINDFFLIDLEPGMNEIFCSYLLKYRLSYRAEIEDVTDRYSLFHVAGARSEEYLENKLEPGLKGMGELDIVIGIFQETEIYIIKINRTGESGFDIYCQSDLGSDFLSSLSFDGSDLKLKPVGTKALETLRIEAGIPVYGKDMDDTTIPIEAGLWSALDFNKGCYIGQEVIARIKWQGRVNWHLVGFTVEEKNEKIGPGSELYKDDKKVGRITSATFSPTINKFLALGYIRRELLEKGTKVAVKLENNSFVEATVSELPFINNFK